MSNILGELQISSEIVDKNTSIIEIGNGAFSGGNSCAVGKNAKVYGSGNIHCTVIGDYTETRDSTYAEAIGRDAKISSANYACQIGSGTNTQVSSLQFLNTQVVNSDGKIPNNSLELTSKSVEMKFEFEDSTISTLTIPYISIS